MACNRRNLCFLLLATLVSSGCSSLYYASMKKIGKEKRDILAQRIMDGKKDQENHDAAYCAPI